MFISTNHSFIKCHSFNTSSLIHRPHQYCPSQRGDQLHIACQQWFFQTFGRSNTTKAICFCDSYCYLSSVPWPGVLSQRPLVIIHILSQVLMWITKGFPDCLLSVLHRQPSSASWTFYACHSKNDQPNEERTGLAAGECWGDLKLAVKPCKPWKSSRENHTQDSQKAPAVCGISQSFPPGSACWCHSLSCTRCARWKSAASLSHMRWQQHRTGGFGQNKQDGDTG